MTSGWSISGLELPVAPSTESKSVNRGFLQESIYKNYPATFQPVVTSYNYTLTGYIWGDIVRQLEDLAKSADTEIVTVVPPTNNKLESTQISTGLFAVSNFQANRDGPMFVIVNGEREIVYKYTLSLTQFADEGVNQNSVEVEPVGGEEFVGTADENVSRGLLDIFGSYFTEFNSIATDQGLLF